MAWWLLAFGSLAIGAPTFAPVRDEGVDIVVGAVAAPLRLSSNGAIRAREVSRLPAGLRLAGLTARDPAAVAFTPDSFVQVSSAGERIEVSFRLALTAFDPARWQALMGQQPAPFHFLTLALPSATVWHQRGWLNATPNADPFPLLQDVHVGQPEISCPWNRNWSYLCPLGGHPIPVIGLWDPAARRYLAYDFQASRAGSQSERYLATAYCWQQGQEQSFIALCLPYGGRRFTELRYPEPGATAEATFELVIDELGSTDDPNERFQRRLFERQAGSLPAVPAMNDLGWIPGRVRLRDFAGPIGLGLFGPGSESTFYPAGTVIVHGWRGHTEMPIDTAARRGDTQAIEQARGRLDELLRKYAKRVEIAGEPCLFWEKPLEGAWKPDWGGPPVTTLHNADAWYPARVLVELYRYDRQRGQARADYLAAIDGVFNWTKHFVWTRNEFADVPSSPFAIGGTLGAAFLLDYYFTFCDDPSRRDNAALALALARNVTWRYLPLWAMDSDRYDSDLDSSFLIEPNSGRDWAALACANEVHWNIDALTQVYVHTGDERMRYYLRGILDRWPALYRPVYETSLEAAGQDAMTEGLGFFDGAGPGRGGRYNYGTAATLPLNEPVGNSKLRVIAGARAAIGFCKDGTHSDLADYRTDGRGACGFRLVSSLPGEFDVSLSYPYVDISKLAVRLTRDGQARTLGAEQVRRPEQSPSSLYLGGLRAGDVIQVGELPADTTAYAPPAVAPSEAAPAGWRLQTLAAEVTLPRDWRDTSSYAGLVCGLRWACGVPYQQTERATAQPAPIAAPEARHLFVAYAGGPAPTVELDNGQTCALSGRPITAWRAWPPMFKPAVLLDRAEVPAGRQAKRVVPNGALLMAVSSPAPGADLAAVDQAWQPAAAAHQARAAQEEAVAAYGRRFAALPGDRIALLPGAAPGPVATFLGQSGLMSKVVKLTERQMVDPAQFSAQRFPAALYLSGERYPKTVVSEGDGREAVIRYLAAGGTLVLLSSEPFPFFYGDGPGGRRGPGEPLLPALGVPLHNAFEQPPAGLTIRRMDPVALPGVPDRLPFPSGDPRLRAIQPNRRDSLPGYRALLRVEGPDGRDYGDAGAWLTLPSGPAQGGKILYLWSTLLTAPQGSTLLGDALTWLLPETMAGGG